MGRDLGLQVSIGGRNDPNVDPRVARATDALDLVALDGAQDLGLQVEAELANLVEEDCSARSRLEGPLSRRRRSGKRSAFVTEYSLSSSWGGMAPQSTMPKGPSRRLLWLWMASDEASLPVPVCFLDEHGSLAGRRALEQGEESARWVPIVRPLPRTGGGSAMKLRRGGGGELKSAGRSESTVAGATLTLRAARIEREDREEVDTHGTYGVSGQPLNAAITKRLGPSNCRGRSPRTSR